MEPATQVFQYKEREVELPNGYVDSDGTLYKTVIVRELSGEEEDLLLDQSEARNGTTITNILNKICKLKDKPSIKIAADLMVVDQFYLLVQARMLTYGKNYNFEVTCQSQPCGKISRINLDLESLEFKPSPNPLSLTESVLLPNSGLQVVFKKNQGKDQGNLSKIQQGSAKDKVSQLLQYKVVEITKDGVKHPKSLIKSLPGEDRRILREAMRKSEGDAETVINVNCFHCGHSMKAEMPFDHAFFCLTADES